MAVPKSFKKYWPRDRIDRLVKLQAVAKARGLQIVARNGGDRRVFLAYFAIRQGNDLLASFWDIDQAENWFKETA
ncbi:hypothetical protein D3227_35130 [Mesorhizobium waimense]|uniref:Uncharacterized protein n=1 Tax=Mesorhizobium waimense TaxID=1300307 RepID=A0A3A5JYK9_9HYPH|nr:hypothetical protein [Mesorhizobium waimense]RJT28131.1 hypothetical protein D3227_35130 [Mesorhizobium waimense]